MNIGNKQQITSHLDSAVLLEQARVARRQYVRELLNSAATRFARMFRARIRYRKNGRATMGYEAESFYRNQP